MSRHLQLHQVAQSPVQPDLECFQGWGIYHLSGQPVPLFHPTRGKKCLLYIQSKSTLFKTVTPCPIATGPTKYINIKHIYVYVLRGKYASFLYSRLIHFVNC